MSAILVVHVGGDREQLALGRSELVASHFTIDRLQVFRGLMMPGLLERAHRVVPIDPRQPDRHLYPRDRTFLKTFHVLP